MRLLLIYIPYGQLKTKEEEVDAKEFVAIRGHWTTDTILPGTSEPASLKEWVEAVGIGEYTHLPYSSFHLHVIRVK